MLKIKNLRGECQHCGGLIEFHAEHTGSNAECPHCGQQTELMLAALPEEESPLRKKAIAFAIVSVLILVVGLLALAVLFKRAKSRTKPEPPPAPVEVTAHPFSRQGLGISAVTLEQGQGSSLVYAVGIVTNTTSRQRFGLRVELALASATGEKLGTATDYVKVVEPAGVWRFQALVADKRVASASVSAIKEAQ